MMCFILLLIIHSFNLIFVQNAMENVENKILEVLEDVGEKMAPVIKVREEMLMARKCFLMIVFQNPNGLERNLAKNFT